MQRIDFEHNKNAITLFTHDSPDHLFNAIFSKKAFYESDLLLKAETLYTKGSWIVDVGANIGNHTIFFAKALSAKVLAFEPFAKSREILLRNVAFNDCEGLVTVQPSALGDVAGRGTTFSPNEKNYGMVSVRPDEAGDIPVGRLDDFVKPDMKISIIKVDVEGGELAVFKGASKTLADQHPHLFAEAANPSDLEPLEKFLKGFGYKIRGRFCATPTYLFSTNLAEMR